MWFSVCYTCPGIRLYTGISGNPFRPHMTQQHPVASRCLPFWEGGGRRSADTRVWAAWAEALTASKPLFAFQLLADSYALKFTSILQVLCKASPTKYFLPCVFLSKAFYSLSWPSFCLPCFQSLALKALHIVLGNLLLHAPSESSLLLANPPALSLSIIPTFLMTWIIVPVICLVYVWFAYLSQQAV